MTQTTAPEIKGHAIDFPAAAAQPGDFLAYTMVTDSLVYEVVRRTASTLTLRRTRDADVPSIPDTRCDRGAYLLLPVWIPQDSDDTGATISVRVRKDGTVRVGSSRLYPAATIDGEPVRRVDYRY